VFKAGVQKCGCTLVTHDHKHEVRKQDLQQHISVHSFTSAIPSAP